MPKLHPENYIVPEKVPSTEGKDLAFAEQIIRAAVPADGDPNGTDSMRVSRVVSMVCGHIGEVLKRELVRLTRQKEAIKKAIRIEENKANPDQAVLDDLEASLIIVRNQLRDARPVRIRLNAEDEMVGLARVRRLVQNDEDVWSAQGCESLRRKVVRDLVLSVIQERSATYVYPESNEPLVP